MESKDMRLEAILDYEMDELEGKAYKLCLIWLDLSKKIFPDMQHFGKMKKGDPRKSLMFKLCYKLVRETNTILEESDYKLYVRAQLDVLKHILNNKGNPVIDVNCLVGEKAWRRWKMWKSKYDSIISKPMEDSRPIEAGVIKAVDGLEKTKEFITKNIGSSPDFDKFKECYVNKNIIRWINFGKISPYYIAISPFVKKLFKEEDYTKINFCIDLYKPCINDVVLNHFKKLFPHEF